MSEGEGVKQCSKCGEVRRLGEFYRNKSRRDGFSGVCKVCTNKRLRCWRAANPEKVREANRRYEEAHPERRRESYRRYRATHPTRHRAAVRRWKSANPDKVRDIDRRYRTTHPEKARENRARYRFSHPDKERARIRCKDARRRQAEGYFTTPEWEALLARCGNRCLCCGVHADDTPEGKLVVSRVVPLAKGGTNWISNLQPLCKRCSSRNGPRPFDYRDG